MIDDAGTPSAELLRELRELAQETAEDIAKIREHGARADGIIGSMLAHSRGQPGERRPTDLNALVRDYVSLAFHGMRAQDNTFQVAIEGDYDPNVGMVDVVPQDLSRVFLNVGSNACYAVRKKSRQGIAGLSAGDPRLHARPRATTSRCAFATTASASPRTRATASSTRSSPPRRREKERAWGFRSATRSWSGSTGERSRVDSQEGEYTEFVITLPRRAEPA